MELFFSLNFFLCITNNSDVMSVKYVLVYATRAYFCEFHTQENGGQYAEVIRIEQSNCIYGVNSSDEAHFIAYIFQELPLDYTF